jgi:hypothetical protein
MNAYQLSDLVTLRKNLAVSALNPVRMFFIFNRFTNSISIYGMSVTLSLISSLFTAQLIAMKSEYGLKHVLYCTILYYIALYCTALSTILYYSILY